MVVLPCEVGASAYLDDEVLVLVAGGLDDGMVDEAGGCLHTSVDRGLHVRQNEVVGEDMSNLVEARDAYVAHTENPSVSAEDRADSIHLLRDSDVDRVVNMEDALNPSMVPHLLNRYPRNQMLVVGHHKNILLHAMRLELTVDIEELPHGMTHHPHDYRNSLFRLRLVSRLEREAQNQLHFRTAL